MSRHALRLDGWLWPEQEYRCSCDFPAMVAPRLMMCCRIDILEGTLSCRFCGELLVALDRQCIREGEPEQESIGGRGWPFAIEDLNGPDPSGEQSE